MSADRDDAAALHREEPRARGDCVRRNRAAPPYQCGRPPSALQSWAHLAGWIQTVVQALGRCVGTAAILHAATRALHPAISGFPNRGLVRSHPSAHRRRRGRLLRHSSIRRNSRHPHDCCRPVASDPPVRRSPGCAHAAGEHPHGRLVGVRRCYQTHWIAEDLALRYAPFAPHYVGLTPPRTPAVAAPWPRPYWGLGLVRSWQRSARWSALSRRQWPTPLVAKSPVVMGSCGVHSAECGAV